MKRMMGGAALMAAVMTLAPLQAYAQAGMRGQREMRDRQARPGVEMIMRMQERLELTEGQLSQLDGLRQAVVQHRAAALAQREARRSERAAQPRDREDREGLREEVQARRAEAEAWREQAEAFSQGIREQVESILTDEQREELQDVVSQARAFERGRRAGMRQQHDGRRQDRGAIRGSVRGQRGGQAWGGARGMDARRGGPPAGARGFRRGGGVDGQGFGQPWLEQELDSAPPPSGS